MSVFIKICGICSRSDLEQICSLEPDAIGFVFWPKSPRYVRPEQAASWLDSIPETIKTVGVFVEPTADYVEETSRICQLDVAQIHLTSNDWKMDRSLFHGMEIWTAPRIDKDFKPAVIKNLRPEPAVVLIDSFDEKHIGGTGQLVDPAKASSFVQMLPHRVMLAGGLNADNVAEAIASVQPWGVDVSSGVEKEPGVKDIRKVAKFIAAARTS